MTFPSTQLVANEIPILSPIPWPFNSADSSMASTPDNDWGYKPTIKTQHSYLETRRSSQDSTSTTISQIIGRRWRWENADEAAQSDSGQARVANGKSRSARREVRVHRSWYGHSTAEPPNTRPESDIVTSEEYRHVFESAGMQFHTSWYTHHPKLSSSERVDLDYKHFASVRQRSRWEDQILNARPLAFPARTWGAAQLIVRHVDRPGAMLASKARVAGYETIWYVSRLNAANKIVGRDFKS